jgi:hypothetical protein
VTDELVVIVGVTDRLVAADGVTVGWMVETGEVDWLVVAVGVTVS